MNSLHINKIQNATDFISISKNLDSLEKHQINMVNWPEYWHNLNVEFSIAYSENYIYLKYWVDENAIIALTDKDNGPVWKDSCVEFFISPNNNDFYYNFEFNCIGACLLGYGNSRHDRQRASDDVLNKIIRVPSLERKTFTEKKENTKWNLFVAIPLECFFNDTINKLETKIEMKANFYKCGDGLSSPHYMTWSPIVTEKPDYHRPDFFGKINFK